ncbi:MAG TPA: formylglycine-generating enzyme family protein [Vineibacter sp.]|nr:formylglycine-generating enzyme family protein [Vineibacter sp.]
MSGEGVVVVRIAGRAVLLAPEIPVAVVEGETPVEATVMVRCDACGAAGTLSAPVTYRIYDDDHFGRIEHWYDSRHVAACGSCGAGIEIELGYTLTSYPLTGTFGLSLDQLQQASRRRIGGQLVPTTEAGIRTAVSWTKVVAADAAGEVVPSSATGDSVAETAAAHPASAVTSPAAQASVLHAESTQGPTQRRAAVWLAAGAVLVCASAAGAWLWHRSEQAAALARAEALAAQKREADAAMRRSGRDCPHCPEMVRIPPGSFMMGAAPGEHEREKMSQVWRDPELPQHRVTIADAFSLGRYEVTRGEFRAFLDATGHRMGRFCWPVPRYDETDRHPMLCANWADATAYVRWLSEITGRRYRLPSEAEWEYAARAGTTTARYWGDAQEPACTYENVDDAAFGCVDGFKDTAPVGSFKPNGFGLYDMLGNAWEWTADCWNPSHVGAPVDGSARTEGDCSYRVMRGGNWFTVPRYARAAARSNVVAAERSHLTGFRVARDD